MKRMHIVFTVVLGLLLLASIGWGALWMYAKGTDVPDGVIAAGIPIGGMDIDEAVAVVSQYATSWEQQQAIVKANGQSGDDRAWTLKELGYSADVKEVLAALEQLRKGSIVERARYRHDFAPKLDATFSAHTDVLANTLKKEWGWLEKNEPVNATRTITANDRVVYTPHQVAYRVDRATIQAKIEEWARHTQTKPPANQVEIAKLAQQKLEVPLPIKELEPEVTLQKLEAEGIDRMIMSFTTDFASSAAGRAYNVTATAKTLNNIELAPDEVFDYGKIVSATEKKLGYREAPVIQNGKLVPGVGGGICQVSSTLYNAVIRAGIDIVERRNHSLPVSYLPIGQDATFADGAINFRFRNSTGKHLIIRTVVENRKLTVKLFGTMPDDVRYDVESVKVKTIEPTVKEVVSDQVPAGGRLILQQGKVGYIVETYQTYFKDGVEVSRKRLSRDTYKAQPTMVGIGQGATPKDGKGPGAPIGNEPDNAIIEDGVGA
ncbi:VanW family protein [Paenibacillus sp. MMS18-CY102]|uniref:VanW family protein n=1 Tax=Paenibacillus sp. MMS18-CY102 TaxID=2682849 RepID=UPI0013662E72|nr:VanW family protein [Paenibacillus sp. MMS18-CY102]MWC30594.1 hypothetical protein [Paenibacillus sp. MMS18-CY102]